jgi:orotidine-5'-phosphate decarboxylase
MTRQDLVYQIRKKRTFLCVGLDPDLEKIPEHLKKSDDPIFEFNKGIIDATHEFCVAYKPNTAFYEAHGLRGWEALEKTIAYLNKNYPDHFTIADAKRGDIGNTSTMYAKAFLEKMDFDSITVAPYMGNDSVQPFLQIRDKWVILLVLTSNMGSIDFQEQVLKGSEEKLFEKVLRKSLVWGDMDNMMYVVGATRASMIGEVRKVVPEHFLLVPGVGAQGGSLAEVCKFGLTEETGLLINASRSILYAGGGQDYAEKARGEAQKLALEMSGFVK